MDSGKAAIHHPGTQEAHKILSALDIQKEVEEIRFTQSLITWSQPWVPPGWLAPPPENQTLLRYGKSSVFGAVKQHEWFPKCAVPFCVALVLP